MRKGFSSLKKAAACVVSAAMAVMLVPATPAVAAVQGGVADGFTYELDPDGSAAITGIVDLEATTLTVPETISGHTVKRVDPSFINWRSAATKLVLPKTLTSICTRESVGTGFITGFYHTSYLEEIEVEAGNKSFVAVDGILYSSDKTRLIVYPGKKPITSFSIPEGTTSLEGNCFSSAYSLQSIAFPTSVKKMNGNPFVNCTSLRKIEVASGNANYSSRNGVLYNKPQSVLCAYPLGKTETRFDIPSSVKTIEALAVAYHPYLKKISIPASVSRDYGNFLGCTNLTSIELADGSQCYSLSNGALFSKDMTKLMAYPAGVSAGTFAVPCSVTTISAYAFWQCNIKELSVLSPNTSFEKRCFVSPNIETIYVPTQAQYKTLTDAEKYIEPSKDPSVPGTRVVYSPGMVGLIDAGEGEEPVLNRPFKVEVDGGMAGFTLTKTYVNDASSSTPSAGMTPLSLKKAAAISSDQAVEYAGEVRVDFYPLGKNRSISFNTLRYNNRLYKISAVNKGVLKASKYVAAVALGNNVANVAAGAFQGCRNLKAVYLGTGIKSIGKSAFCKCPKLASVSVASTALKAGKVGASAFKGTAKKAAFRVPKSKLKAYKSLFQKAGASKKASFKKA